MFTQFFFQTLFADDFKWNVHGKINYYNLILVLLVQLAWGMPLAPKKFLGVLEVDWVGYWVDYGKFEAGLSDSRCQWLQKWLQDQLAQKVTVVRDFT